MFLVKIEMPTSIIFLEKWSVKLGTVIMALTNLVLS